MALQANDTSKLSSPRYFTARHHETPPKRSLASGMSHEEILDDFPYLTEEDIRVSFTTERSIP
jgi:hypothetical protein